jgi:nicotinamidase-related amidase
MNKSDGRRITEPKLGRSPVVLLLVDFVNPLRFPGAEKLAPLATAAALATQNLRRRLSNSGIRTIYANDNYGDWNAEFRDIWRRCSKAADTSARIARLLRPATGDITILKPRHSAFHATPLDLLLRQLKCKRLILTGLAADNCVLFTAMDAYLRGYALWVPQDCVAAESEEAKVQALAQMRRALKAETRPASNSSRRSTLRSI